MTLPALEIERLSVPLSHRVKRQLQTMADDAGLNVGEFIASVLTKHTEGAGSASLASPQASTSHRLSSAHTEVAR